MRQLKLPQFASLDEYDQGPREGSANKVATPTAYNNNGIVPGPNNAYAAEWENHWKHHVQKQVDQTADAVLKNWAPVFKNTGTPLPDLRCAHQKGSTVFIAGAQDQVRYLSDFEPFQSVAFSADALHIVTLAPAAGNFDPRDLAYSPQLDWLVVVGTNAGATQKNIWQGPDVLNLVELTGPAMGAVEKVTVDRTDGAFYAFMSDTNRAVLRKSVTGVGGWSAIGVRGSGAKTPGAAGLEVATHDGETVIAYADGGSLHIEYGSLSSWTVRMIDTLPSAHAYAVRWSPVHNLWTILGSNKLYTFATPDGLITEYEILDSPDALGAIDSGTLTDVGEVTALAPRVRVRPSLIDDLRTVHLGEDVEPEECQVLFDGSAVWVLVVKSDHEVLYRTARV